MSEKIILKGAFLVLENQAVKQTVIRDANKFTKYIFTINRSYKNHKNVKNIRKILNSGRDNN